MVSPCCESGVSSENWQHHISTGNLAAQQQLVFKIGLWKIPADRRSQTDEKRKPIFKPVKPLLLPAISDPFRR